MSFVENILSITQNQQKEILPSTSFYMIDFCRMKSCACDISLGTTYYNRHFNEEELEHICLKSEHVELVVILGKKLGRQV